MVPLSSGVDSPRHLDAAGRLRLKHALAAAARTSGLLPAGTPIILVTSPSHSIRACAAFEQVGFRVYCDPVPGDSYFRANVYERLASIKYRLKGWIR